jgi:hypothetical protein
MEVWDGGYPSQPLLDWHPPCVTGWVGRHGETWVAGVVLDSKEDADLAAGVRMRPRRSHA